MKPSPKIGVSVLAGYQTRSEIGCPKCGTAGIANASTWYYHTHQKIQLECRKCHHMWDTRDDMVLDGRDLQGGKDMAASEMM